MTTTGWLKSIDALKSVPPDQLDWFIGNSSLHRLMPDDLLFVPGTPVDATYIVKSGRISMYVFQNTEAREYTQAGPGTINGYLPFSRGKINFGYGKAIEETLLLAFPVSKINEMICTHLELTEALVHVMTSRVRDYTTRLQQDEKMMALGKLSAGLAHELNNPASAILRDASLIKSHLKAARNSCWEIAANPVEAQTVKLSNDFVELKAGEPVALPITLKQRMMLEDELANWLASQQFNRVAMISETLAEFQVSLNELVIFLRGIPISERQSVLNWISEQLLIARMVNDMASSSQKIVELVASVKVYTHMDQNRDKQYTDIHEGIHNTLVMLRHKTAKGQVKIIEDFDPFLPPVNALAGELNQVWTNLVDNSIDAMADYPSGVLKITTYQKGDAVYISFTDNGPGFDPALKDKIFEPFFTTKGSGRGSGLGLDVVQRVVREHGGNIRVETVPGRTFFEVSLPVKG